MYIGIIGYILGLCRDNEKENGSYCSIIRLYWGYNELKMVRRVLRFWISCIGKLSVVRDFLKPRCS